MSINNVKDMGGHISHANFITIGITIVLMVTVIACSGEKEGCSLVINIADGGGSSSVTMATPASLDEHSATVVVVTPAIYLRMSEYTKGLLYGQTDAQTMLNVWG